MKAEILRQELKHKRQWDELKGMNSMSERELEQIQVCPIHSHISLCLHCHHCPVFSAGIH